MPVAVGDSLPDLKVMELVDGKPTPVAIKDLFGKKGILFGVPGAFTPGCSKVSISPNV